MAASVPGPGPAEAPALSADEAARALGIARLWLPPALVVHRVPASDATRLIADDVARHLRDAVRARGRAVLAVSGGRSPLPLFAALAAHALPWDRVDITLVDERAVPEHHAASNAALVRSALLQGPAAAARFHAWPAEALDARATDTLLEALGPADVTLLGMGADGHTASLFPGADGVADWLRAVDPDAARPAGRAPDAGGGDAYPSGLPAPRCAVVHPDPLPAEAPFARLTQTPAHLVRSRHLLLPVSGDAKRATLALALQASADERCRRYPIGVFLRQTQAPVSVWLTDTSSPSSVLS